MSESVYFTDSFDLENITYAANKEKARLRDVQFSLDRQNFEKEVLHAFVNGYTHSQELVVPDDCMPETKIAIIRELMRKFPGRVETFHMFSNRWYGPVDDTPLEACAPNNIPTRIRIRCK